MATEPPRAVWCCSICGAIYHKDYPRCPADGAEVVMAECDPLLGSSIGNYQIDKLIGEGGMGRVYLAHHTNLPNKRYAFKVLLGDHSASVAMRARFTREAERASQLDHPNVVKVVDFGQTRHGLLYIVMDYVDGPSLVSLIQQQPMAPVEVVALSRAIAKGLVYAHNAGIVHRDLKPENILVSNGVPKIVDFGLAMSLDQGDARLTESGMTMGTPAFAAPEQLSGKPIDHRADLYALGMTMFEMATGGMSPFEGHILEIVSARTTRDAPLISERAPHLAIPRGLEDIVARLTRRRPADRFASAREMIDALDRVRLGSQAERSTQRVAHRRARGLWLAAGVLAACGGGAAAWFAIDSGIADAPLPGIPVRRASEPAPIAAPSVVDQPSGSVDPARVADEPAPVVVAAVPEIASPEPAPPAADPPSVAPPAAPAHGGPTPTRHRHRPRAARPSVRVEPTPPPARVAPAPEDRRALVAPPSPVVPPPPPAPPRELLATIDGVDVSGSLPAGVVQRAVERRRTALSRCAPATAQIVVAHFTIGEARRAQGVRVSGPTAEANACIEAALADVRTEAAPDVGAVEVMVRIAFVVKT